MSTIRDYETVSGNPGPYQSGNPITIQADLTDGSSTVDPAVVAFNLRLPDDTLVTYTYGSTDPEVTNPTPGTYLLNLPADWLPGQTYYECVTDDPEITVPGELYIIPSSVIPPDEAPGPKMPPCTSWIAGEDLAGTPAAGDASPTTLDAAAVMASMLMYELTGRQWSGLCGPVTVRPCRAGGCGGLAAGLFSGGWQWTWGYWSGDWGYGWFWGNEDGGRLCSCGYDSKVELAGYPVSQIVEVKIDGNVVPATFTDGSPQYRLDEWKYLTRLSDPANANFPLFWPLCQRLDLEDDQPGTWSVKYLYGVAPPPLGVEAAKQLGAQILMAINNQPCMLPANVSRVVRQGASIERITPLAQILRQGATGLFLVDAAIAAYNPTGLRRRPAVWTPETGFPRRVGSE